MSDFEFVIPLQKDDLLEAHAGQYHVEDVTQPRFLLSKIQDAARAYNSEGVEYILEHFDTYFSIIVHGNKLEWNVINKGFDHILRAAKSISDHLEPIFQEQEIDPDIRTKNLNLLKMIMYLYTSIMKTKDTKLAADNSTKLTLGKKGKKTVDQDEFCGWTESEKQAALVTLHLVVQQPLSRLWDPPLADDNFVSMVADPCYKGLEEQIIKTKSVRETIFQILGVLIKKYNHGTACIIKMVQILQMFEHSVSPICAGVVQLTKDFGLGTFGPQMVREIAEALASSEEDTAGMGTEVGAAKNCGGFLLELTKELPKEMTAAITTLQPYLESDESYTLRITVLGMMCAALRGELRGEGLADAAKILRDDFLDDLYEHIHDMSAYVRHKVLQYWNQLQKENCVPVVRQRSVLERTIGRLKDKAALVRKAAVQLLKVFIECNPFSAQLKQDILEEQLQSELKILEELQQNLNPGPDPELMKQWDSIEKDVISTINEKLDTLTQDEPELSQASILNVYDSIRKHINNKDYYRGYLVVKHAERQYPNAKLLRCDMERSDQIEYFVALLRNVFVTPDRVMSTDNELALHRRVEEKEAIVAFLQESVHFSKMISEAIPVVNSLLMSKQQGDVNEAIEFFTIAHHFNIESAKIGVANMLMLVWSPDQDKREAVERAYREMYLECENKSDRARAFAMAKKLASLVLRVDRGSALALHHLVGKWVGKGDLTPSVVQVLWEMCLHKLDGTTEADSKAALTLLVMISAAKPSVTLANLQLICDHGLQSNYQSRTLSSQLLQTLSTLGQKYPPDHLIFTTLHDSLLHSFTKLNKFVSFAGTSIDLIYALSDMPDKVIIKLLAELYKKVEESMVKNEEMEEEVSLPDELLTRFVFVLGHVALQQLIYLDISVYSELRRRNQVREERKEEEKRKKKITQFATPGKARGRVEALRRQTLNSSSASSRSHRTASVQGSTNTTVTEDEAGLEGAVANDADAEYVRNVCERDIVGPDTALARYIPLLRHLLATPAKCSRALHASAALAYTRYMLISNAVCEDGLQLMVTVLKRSKHVSLRTNLTIAFADLTLRFPNLTQPWTHHIYHILSDEEVEVRQCAVKMLSFLVLHEMVRVKGQIADMALCCADKDPRVATMTRAFFRTLAHKGNALYNVMPDITSRLSDPVLQLDEKTYRVVMRYIISLIQKDRQMEALVEKLCQRFKLSTEERQWCDLSYCLSLFTYNERSLRKLIENIDCFREKLHCQGVMDNLNTLMNNTAKMARAEIKALVTELGDKIEECFAVKDDNGDGEDAERSPKPATPRATPRRKPRRNKPRSPPSPDENEPPANVEGTPQSVRKSNRRAATRANRRAHDSDDSDDEDFQKKEDEVVFKKPATRKRR